MDASEQIRKFSEYFETRHNFEILEALRTGQKFFVVDFLELSKFDPELADVLLDEPENVIRAAEIAVEQFDVEGSVKGFKVRFKNLPASQLVMIKDIRAEHIGRFLAIIGLVRQKSDVRPKVTIAKFECPSCGNIITVPQLDTTFKEPYKCGCGRKGKFRLLSKELVDAQRIVLEESPEDLEGGEQPKRMGVFLERDLVSPLSEKKTNPGSKILVNGVVNETPIIESRTGTKSTRFELFIESNYVEAREESYGDIIVSPEEEAKIKELSDDKNLFPKMVNSIAPSIYGHDKIKEALILQLMAGVRKKRSDGAVNRGDIHILLIGDPGCIAGDSQIALAYKGMDQIQNLGNRHLQPIKEIVTKIRKHSKDKPYDFATVFHHYRNQPVLKVITETGKEVVCTYNQPFLTKTGWQRADEMLPGTQIRVTPKIPNHIKNLVPTGFTKVEKKTGLLKKVSIPDKFTPELASLCGYIAGDGNIHPNGYRVTLYVNDEEKDLISKLSNLCMDAFSIQPSLITKTASTELKSIDDGNGLLRQFISKQTMYLLEINSRQVTRNLSFLSDKRVPQQIFKSPKKVIARFISWLFEADGCAFGKGRGRTSIQLKSSQHELLRGVQLLLLYFGIQSRIIEDNLCIRRSRDMELFAKHIGFNSQKKKMALNRVLGETKLRNNMQKRKTPQRYERITQILPAGITDVYDFEVPVSHTFIANGIVCHNSGKSQLLKRITNVAPKARYVSGKGASAAGLTASVVKDEFMKGWSLEAGALPLTNRGICMIDELDKMTKEDREAMHEALEQQTVSIAKANIQATLRCETTVLAAANPKFGRFNPYEPIAGQIDLPPALINRFDLIFPIKDLPSPDKDEKMAKFILSLHKEGTVGYDIETSLLRKYIAYAKQNFNPVLTESAFEELKEYYLKMRASGSTEGSVATIPISARQLEALVRLAEAAAKLRLSDKVQKRDAKKAVELLHYCLTEVGMDRETGKIDIDRIATGITATQRSKIGIVREIIAELENKIGKTIPVEDIMREAAARNVDEDDVEEVIDKLKRSGDIFEPKRGFVQRIY